MLTCYLPPTSGGATVNGFDIFHQSEQVRENLGYLPENVPLYTEMKVREYLDFRGRLRKMHRADRATRIDYVLERCWLTIRPAQNHRAFVQGISPARRPGRCAAAQSRGADSGRADGRPGPDADPRNAQADQGSGRASHGYSLHAHFAGGRGDVRPRDRHRRRARSSPRDRRKSCGPAGG